MEPVFPFELILPANGGGTLSGGLHRQLRAAILDGRVAAGAAMPSTREAAAALGIARNTVVAAYDLLIAEGYVLPQRGAKAVVADVAPRILRRRLRVSSSTTGMRLNPLWGDPPLRPEPDRKLPARCFRLGVPEHKFFPHETWRRLHAQALRAWSKQPFAYPPSEGLPELRAAIAQHVAFARAVACAADDVIVTSGAQQSVDLIARMLVTPGQTRVAVENPGYPQVRAAFAAAGAQLVPVPVDAEGLRVDELPHDVRIVSVTPSHQSPTGVAMSLPRRMGLLDFARTHDAMIVEDDYDGEFRFGGRPLDALQTLDGDGRVFYVGTFSKSLFPALRKGFVVAPAWARDRLVAIKHCCDSHCDAVVQSTLAAFIRDGHLARHVRRMRPIYAQRREALLDGLRLELGAWLEPIPSEAGLHLSARIREPKLAARIVAHVREHLPGAQSTTEYALSPIRNPAVTFGYGVIDAKDIRPALVRLRRSLDRELR
jgi:GntR family transcriptional regulator/MocR family aminotransferase